MYKLEKRCGITSKTSIVKEFDSEKSLSEFVKKQDERLNGIHEKQKKLYSTTSKFVFFNVYAQDFLKYGNVINWYSTWNKTRATVFHYSLRKYA